MTKRFLLLVFLLVLVIPMGVQAQDEIRLAYLQVDLWPEYDRPEMLVIFRASLAADVSLPVDVTFRIPAAVGDPNAVAVRQPDGALLNAMYESQTEAQWTYVTVSATSPDIQLEYYDPQLEKSDDDRRFEFVWLAEYDVDSMLVIVQQPLGSSQMSIEPDLGEFQPGSDGMQYYSMEIGAPSAGDEVSVKVDYQKSSDSLSIESFQVQPSAPITDGGTQRSADFDLLSLLPWLLGGLGVLLVVGGIFWYWRSGRDVTETKPTNRGRRAASTPEDRMDEGADGGIYCHQCGKRAASNDRFCRTCGTRMRKE
ncbi:MAG: zinc ribbon domain-containing protein [Anaerolineales bacterium]|nr:zinc ribbon domain-containing protein [Chloroflexota bacterium]MBL6982603.1 zinc ribbon domain-containing protein [Anaerolineales bacterium]